MKKSRSSKTEITSSTGLPLAVFADQASLTELRSKNGLFSRAWGWLQSRKPTGADSRRLRLADTVSLGEKRFVAVVQVAGRDFLIAGGPANIALLAQLNPNEPFEDVLRTTLTIPSRQPPKPKHTVKRKPAKARLASKPAPQAAMPPIDRVAPVMSDVQVSQSNVPASHGHASPQNNKPGRKSPAKRKPVAPPSHPLSDEHAEPESASVAAAFNMPEAFRFVLQNTMAADGKAPNGKLAKQPNGRSESDHTGHWA